jgi:HAD superfamily hydrolase (TIGR01458 family)
MKQKIKALFIDLEGTLYFKSKQIEGADNTIKLLRQKGFILRFLTNTDSKSTHSIVKDLEDMGLDIHEEEIFTPITALRQFIKQNEGKKFHMLLSNELKNEFIKDISSDVYVDYVVVGDFRDAVSYESLNKAFQYIMEGAEIIALQKGKYFIRSNGYNIDTGAFVSLFEYASGKTAHVLGKPSVEFFNLALQNIGYQSSETAIIGDDITTDIVGARRCKSLPILVRTGKFNHITLEQSTEKPEYIVESIADIPKILEVYSL